MIAIKNVILPNKTLSNFKLEDATKRLKIPSFRGLFFTRYVTEKAEKESMRHSTLR